MEEVAAAGNRDIWDYEFTFVERPYCPSLYRVHGVHSMHFVYNFDDKINGLGGGGSVRFNEGPPRPLLSGALKVPWNTPELKNAFLNFGKLRECEVHGSWRSEDVLVTVLGEK